jgi:hypothetical protein
MKLPSSDSNNQLSTYIGKKEKKSFWDAKPFLKQRLPNWKKWQKA